jgi:hypothetical protein
MWFIYFFSRAKFVVGFGGPEKAKNLAGQILRPIQTRIATPSFEKILPGRQAENVRYGLSSI